MVKIQFLDLTSVTVNGAFQELLSLTAPLYCSECLWDLETVFKSKSELIHNSCVYCKRYIAFFTFDQTILSEYSINPDILVRRNVSYNPFTPLRILNKLKTDVEPDVRDEAIKSIRRIGTL